MKFLKYISMAVVALSMSVFTSCSDDDNVASAPMSIDKIFLEDAKSTVTDREVTFARLGQLIRIQGKGFLGLKKIYINGYDTYFNNALLTDNNVWVTLNSNTPVEKADANVRNTITLVKDETSITYDFTIRASAPTITSVDNTLPKPGETVNVYGANLHETTSVTLPGGIVVTQGITNDEDGEWFSFTMPEGVTEAGAITSEGANGIAMSPNYFNQFAGYIINYDEDGHGDLGGWSATFRAEDLVDDPLNTGRGKVVMLIPEQQMAEGGVAAGVSNIKGFYTAGNDSPDDDWTRMITNGVIDADAPVSEVALQFDVYVPEAWDLTGQLEITLQNNLSNYGYGSACTKPSSDYLNQASVWVPWFNEEDGTHAAFTTGARWQTITLPLTKFGNYSAEDTKATFADVVADRNAGSYRNLGILFCNSDIEITDSEGNVTVSYPSAATQQRIYIDNLRIVSIAENTVSDFDD